MRELTATVRLAVQGTLLGVRHHYQHLLRFLNPKTYERNKDPLRKTSRDHPLPERPWKK